jgi:hypothetical protein
MTQPTPVRVDSVVIHGDPPIELTASDEPGPTMTIQWDGVGTFQLSMDEHPPSSMH